MCPLEGMGEHRELLVAGFEAVPFPEMSLSLALFLHCTFPALCPTLSHLEFVTEKIDKPSHAHVTMTDK